MKFFKHCTTYNKYVIKSKTNIVFKAIFTLSGIIFYQLAVCLKITPKLYYSFPDKIAKMIIYGICLIILFFSWLFVFLKSKEISRTEATYFLLSLGFNKRDICLLKIQRTIMPTFIASLFITATCISQLSLDTLIRYLYQPVLFTILILLSSIAASFIDFPQYKAKKNHGKLVNIVFFHNKYLANFYKDLLMLKQNFDFIACILMELLVFALYYSLISYERIIYFPFLYLLIWFASLTTQSVFQIDTPYAMAIKSFALNIKEFFKLKVFDIMILCLLPALVFLVLNLALGNIGLTDVFISALIMVVIIPCLACGSAVIACSFFPHIKESSVLILIYYITGIVPLLMILISMVMTIRFWRSKNA